MDTPEAQLAEMLMTPFQQNYQSMTIGGVEIFARADNIVRSFYKDIQQIIVAVTLQLMNKSKNMEKFKEELPKVLGQPIPEDVLNSLKINKLLYYFTKNNNVFDNNKFDLAKLKTILNNTGDGTVSREAMAGVLRMAEKYNQLTKAE